jgi:superfamily II DNA or RNA helicase
MINKEKLKIQEEAFSALRANNFRGIVILPTGTGKTFVLIECLRALWQPGMRVLYTCDSQLLRDGGFDDELRKWGAEQFIPLIEKKCYAGAYKMEEEYYDILLADEGDYALTPEYSKLFFKNKFKYIIFVSATLDAKKRKIAKEIAPIVYAKKPKEIEDAKVINKSQFFIVPYMLNDKENRTYLMYNERFKAILNEQPPPFSNLEQTKQWQDKRQKNLDFLSIDRKHFLASLESSAYICRKLMKELYEQDQKAKMLVFCGLNSQADRVCKYSYHSGSEHLNNLEKFDKGEIVALSVCGKVNRGVNINGVKRIIAEHVSRSETAMIQKTGRGRRLDVDDILEVYLLLPYFKTAKGKIKPTIVEDWIITAARNLGIENRKIYYVKS